MDKNEKMAVVEGFQMGKDMIIGLMKDKEFIREITNMYVQTVFENSRTYGETIGMMVNEVLNRGPEELNKVSLDFVEGVLDTIDPRIVESFSASYCAIKFSTVKFRLLAVASKFAGLVDTIATGGSQMFKDLGFKTLFKKVTTTNLIEPSESDFSDKEAFKAAKEKYEKDLESFKGRTKAYETARAEDKKLSSEYLLPAIAFGTGFDGVDFSAMLNCDEEFTGE